MDMKTINRIIRKRTNRKLRHIVIDYKGRGGRHSLYIDGKRMNAR